MNSENLPLSALCSIRQGRYLSPSEMSEAKSPEAPVPVIGGNGVLGYTDRVSNSRDVVLVTCRGSRCGLLQWVRAPVWVSNNAIACDTGTDIGNQLLRYLLSAANFGDVTTGSAQPQITIGHLSLKRFEVPPKERWSGIVCLLSVIDNRIALLRETNATLEAIAQALFKSWFVDFDPVRAKQQGSAPAAMDEATAALFPNGFDNSASGDWPQGWQLMPIGDVVECVGGTTPDTKNDIYWTPAEHAWTTPKDLSGLAAPVLLRTDRCVSTTGLAKIGSGLLPAGTLLMSSRAPIGYLAVAQMPVAINQGYIAMLPGSRLPPLFMLFWCRKNMETIKAHANGSTFMEISKKAFRAIPVLVPPSSVVDAFREVAAPLFDRLAGNEMQAQTLAAIRDSLLPRLISGQLRLPDVEEALA